MRIQFKVYTAMLRLLFMQCVHEQKGLGALIVTFKLVTVLRLTYIVL